jgi:hypothetical protein
MLEARIRLGYYLNLLDSEHFASIVETYTGLVDGWSQTRAGVTGGSDHAEHYRTQRVTRHGQRYLVEVRALNRADTQKSLPVIAEVVRWKGRWVFVNFHYPQGNGAGSRDLRSILKELRSDRRTGRV